MNMRQMPEQVSSADRIAVGMIWAVPTLGWGVYLGAWLSGDRVWILYSRVPAWFALAHAIVICAAVPLALYWAARAVTLKPKRVAKWIHGGCAASASIVMAAFLDTFK